MRKKYLIGAVLILCALFLAKWVVFNTYPLKYDKLISRYAKEYNIDPYLVAAVIKAESNFKSRAVSHKNAIGLMQITDSTAKWIAQKMGMKDYTIASLNEEETNIKMGCWYLNNLNEEFHDVNLVLAAYNAGRGNVNNWLKDEKYSKNGVTLHKIPFRETQRYVRKIERNYKIYKLLYKNRLK
ncbi:lytic transglycosylase domain-containing protein [Clostridium oryzae]|uniref:Soluble lytic murein transglycosylase n=1 Tax=Clostridium oryzae TaxID=1450648 RepID=A0A1V4IUM3_9CLOT|nr:lytic transglycosylase domain-containing protein [Clostridium oryzae]OPJ63741.1 soluble lytic murein transglycosylase precursor [Clostridium oryzae]